MHSRAVKADRFRCYRTLADASLRHGMERSHHDIHDVPRRSHDATSYEEWRGLSGRHRIHRRIYRASEPARARAPHRSGDTERSIISRVYDCIRSLWIRWGPLSDVSPLSATRTGYDVHARLSAREASLFRGRCRIGGSAYEVATRSTRRPELQGALLCGSAAEGMSIVPKVGGSAVASYIGSAQLTSAEWSAIVEGISRKNGSHNGYGPVIHHCFTGPLPQPHGTQS